MEVKNKKTYLNPHLNFIILYRVSTGGRFEEDCITINNNNESDPDEVNLSARAMEKQKQPNPTNALGPSTSGVEQQHFE